MLEAVRFQMAEGAFKKWAAGVDMSMLDLDVEALRVRFKAGYDKGVFDGWAEAAAANMGGGGRAGERAGRRRRLLAAVPGVMRLADAVGWAPSAGAGRVGRAGTCGARRQRRLQPAKSGGAWRDSPHVP